MLVLFISAFLLSLIFNAAPGAIFAETVRQGLLGLIRDLITASRSDAAHQATVLEQPLVCRPAAKC